jgi:acetyltransferase-like isoleucine patch superfamily enzyme
MERVSNLISYSNSFLTSSSIIGDETALPPQIFPEAEDEKQLEEYPWITAPIFIDYGTNVKVGNGVFINANCTILDTCLVSIGARTLLGPNISLYSGTHPEDPYLRNGLKGPEMGKPITIGEDVWIGGNVVILPGVTVGNGAVIGAGSVVTKDVAELTIVVGNPAKFLRKVKTATSEQEQVKAQPIAQPIAHPVRPTPADYTRYTDGDQGW